VRARAWLGLLYAFFRLETGISARELPPSEELLLRGGWSPVATADLQHGLIRSAVLARTGLPYWSSTGICMTRAERESMREAVRWPCFSSPVAIVAVGVKLPRRTQ
jgi:hypothetical protein